MLLLNKKNKLSNKKKAIEDIEVTKVQEMETEMVKEMAKDIKETTDNKDHTKRLLNLNTKMSQLKPLKKKIGRAHVWTPVTL